MLMSYLFCIASLASAATSQGSILFWHNSGCGNPIEGVDGPAIAFNRILNIDACVDLPYKVKSYRIDSRPSCSNGTAAAFGYFGSHDCQDDGSGLAANSEGTDTDEGTDTEFDGMCLGLAAFNSVAFICDGLGEADISSTAVLPSIDSSTTINLSPSKPTITTTHTNTSTAASLYAYYTTAPTLPIVSINTQPIPDILPSGAPLDIDASTSPGVPALSTIPTEPSLSTAASIHTAYTPAPTFPLMVTDRQSNPSSTAPNPPTTATSTQPASTTTPSSTATLKPPLSSPAPFTGTASGTITPLLALAVALLFGLAF